MLMKHTYINQLYQFRAWGSLNILLKTTRFLGKKFNIDPCH